MNYSEKRAMLLEDSRKALNQGLYVQQAGRFKRPNSKPGVEFIDLVVPRLTPWRGPLLRRLQRLQLNWSMASAYQPPKSTISDHLRDCFGFWCYKRHDRFDEFVDAFHKALVKDMPWLKSMGFSR